MTAVSHRPSNSSLRNAAEPGQKIDELAPGHSVNQCRKQNTGRVEGARCLPDCLLKHIFRPCTKTLAL